MATTDLQIGQNLSALRGELSQKDLAAKMRNLGYKWSQATVWSVETGERPLRLAEATDLARILGTNLNLLTGTAAAVRFEQVLRDADEADQALRTTLSRYRRALVVLAIEADRMLERGIKAPVPDGIIQHRLRTTPEDIVAVERRRREGDDANNSASSLERQAMSTAIEENIKARGGSFTRLPSPKTPFIDILREMDGKHGQHPETT